MPSYKAQKNSSGTYDIYDGSQKIATGSDAILGDYGLTPEKATAAPPPIQQPAPSPSSLTPIENPTPASSLRPATTPNLPQPQAPAVQTSYFDSVAKNVQTTRDALQGTYDSESARIQSQLDALEKQKQDILGKEQELSQPFQQQYEETQRQALHVNENFDANQRLAGELESLVHEAQSRLTGVATDFTSKDYGAAVYNKTLSDITARAGLIQSAMAAYNGQIGQAYTMIDRSVAAINADRHDQISYYDTLLSLNNQGILRLKGDQKDIAQAKLDQLKSDAEDAQKTADTIKQAMLNPTTAQAYAQAGVTLTDSPDEINKKLADYAYSKELANTSSEFAKSGFTAMVPGQSAPQGAQVVTIKDSKGVEHAYYKATTGKIIGSAASGYYYANSDGTVTPLGTGNTGNGNGKSSTKPPTVTQMTYGNYAPRLQTADKTIDELTPSISSISPITFAVYNQLPSFLQPSDVQQYNQAKLNFINAVLRQESGAAISASEYEKYAAQYFPVPGDSKETIAQKAQNRDQVIQSYIKNAGSAYSGPADDPYAEYRSQLQSGEILVQRGNQVLAITPDELQANDERL